jgi:hypothetical protein
VADFAVKKQNLAKIGQKKEHWSLCLSWTKYCPKYNTWCVLMHLIALYADCIYPHNRVKTLINTLYYQAV